MRSRREVVRWEGLTLALGVVLMFGGPAAVAGGTFSVFSRTYVRDEGQPDVVADAFSVQAPAAAYTLRIDNGGGELSSVSAAVVTINGVDVVRTNDFNQNVQVIERAVSLTAENQIEVDLRSIPSSGFVLRILGVDDQPPTIAAAVSPPANAAGWHNADATVTFTCADAVSGIAACPEPVVVSREGAGQVVTGVATDQAGNTAAVQVTVNLDKTPPAVAFTAPAESPVEINAPSIAVAGTVADANPVVAFDLAGASVPLAGGGFAATLAVADGTNPIVARARDIADNLGGATVEVVRFSLPEVAILSPTEQTLTAAPTTAVSGTVSAGVTAVEVNGVAGSVSGTGFTVANVPLFEGNNLLTAVATDGGGRSATASVQVIRDSTAPRVAIHAPATGSVTTAAAVSVSGMVNDLIIGSLDPREAEVTVNGVPAEVANRNFVAASVPLAIGDNTVTATATDLSGNVGHATVVVRRLDVAGQPQIAIVSGDLQQGEIGSALPDPLVVSVVDGVGSPLRNRQVTFRVVENNGTVENIAGSGPILVEETDALGRAQTTWTLGTRAGAGKNRVEATSPGIAGVAVFTATGVPAGAARINLDAGNLQYGLAGQELPRPFVAVVTDAGNNRLPDVPVTFRVVAGGGSFGGQETTTVDTDAYGRALAAFALGPEAGQDNNVVEATFPGNPGGPAVFAASGRVAGDPAATSISGVVLDNSNLPIPGVTLKIEETNLQVRTDEQGQFRITGAPVGRVRLVADGSTAERPGSWPSLQYEIVTVSGQDNTVGMPIFLLPIDLPHGVFVDETHGGTLTLADLPGFSLTIKPGSATFPGGGRSGVVSVTLVHSDKVPMIPNFGQQPRFIITIQPAGTRFDPPAAMTMPNVDGLAPGEVTEMYSFDHDLGMFVSIGTATVSADGSVLRSDPGVGVVEGGWHCGGNPASAGGAQNASVNITTGDPVKLKKKDDTTTVSASGGPQPGTYSWSTDKPDVIGFVGPTSGASASSVTIKALKPGSAKVKVTYTCESGASDDDEIEALVATKDVVVIAWVDPRPIDLAALEGGANFLLKFYLNGILCGPLLFDWSFLGKPTALFGDGDRRYSNGFLLKNSPNHEPPATIDPASERGLRDYRLFNRLQAYIKNNGGTPQVVEYLQSDTDVGPTPDPCGILSPVGGETHSASGAKGVSPGNAVYQLVEGRIGTLGQSADLTLNDCFGGYFLANLSLHCLNWPFAIGHTTPWIYDVIRFDADSNHLPVIHQIFPTYYVYEDNQRVQVFPEVDPEIFIALDDSAQISPSDIP